MKEGQAQQLDLLKADLYNEASRMKEPVRRAKFIPRVGNWEDHAKRQDVALYGDYMASPQRRSHAKAGKVPVSRVTGEKVVEGDGRPPPSIAAEIARQQTALTNDRVSNESGSKAAATASASVLQGHQTEERYADPRANWPAMKQAWNERAAEASDKLAAAFHSVINETAQLERDFADYIVDFESLIREHRNFVEEIDAKLAALESEELAAADAAAVAAAPPRLHSVGTPMPASFSSTTGAGPQRQKLPSVHVELSGMREATMKSQTQGARPLFSVKKTPSKWAAAARRRVDRFGG